MKQKKLVIYFMVVSLSLILFLPLLNVSFAYMKNKKINFHDYTRQQFFSTDNIESMTNYFGYKVFNTSFNEAQVVIGKDDFFFLGNGYVNVIDKTKGTYKYTEAQIDIWTTKLKKLQEWYEKEGIEFVIVIAPNKHTIYSGKLPKKIIYKEGGTITDAIVQSALAKNIHILNLKQILREKKQDKQLYFSTDTHWNHYGALVGYLHTMEYINHLYNKHYKIPQYSITKTTSSGGGDLTNFLKIRYFLSDYLEQDYHFIFQNSQLCYGKISKSYQLERCTPRNKTRFNRYTIEKNPANKENLLYLCDSFGMKNSEIYQKTFHTVWRLHNGYIYGKILANFIQKHKPDIVIYQIVERDLGGNTLVTDLPPSIKKP